ncbi:GOLPH3/VPS74 family protein [Paractinoplanes rishiriensis]|uniref:GPP34 family phosphoprotein n=1 Tax=Paractinoplanes rishiriensis TaxID=1050105 RepID=A0A919JPH3_9ACTN|nr:GPP34 family phosphoprotein [Actinoplanes rishiriensis]GIE92761.1 hypothetical protein Ari01nite_02260 [Actinoplanes rishiriensis]
MAVPGSLPQRIYLLAYDPAKGRVRMGSRLGAMLRAAALAGLYLDGHLVDERGRAAVGARKPTGDPVLDGLLDEIARARPHRWYLWIGRRQNATMRAVREQLDAGGWVRLEPRRILGLFPTTRVTVRDPRVRKELLGRVGHALKDPVDRVDPADAALVAVVAAADLKLVLNRSTRRASKRRIEELTRHCGPIGPALRTWIELAVAGETASA